MPAAQSGSNATLLLRRAREGDEDARAHFVSLVYGELRRLARSQRHRHGESETLNTTALVHEAYERLIPRDIDWNGRRHFFGYAARAMRDVLVDHARAQSAAKRGGPGRALSLDEDLDIGEALVVRAEEVIGLDAALEKLAAFDPDAAQVVELRYFAGLTIEETAEVVGVSVRTVNRRWTAARAWLYRALAAQPVDQADG